MAAETWLFNPVVETAATANAKARKVLMFFDIGNLPILFAKGDFRADRSHHTQNGISRP
jgi:hypothetical protein